MMIRFEMKNTFTKDEIEQWDGLASDDKIDSVCSSIPWIVAVGTADGIRQNIFFAYDEKNNIVGGLQFDYSFNSKSLLKQYRLDALLSGYNPFYDNVDFDIIDEQLDRSLTVSNRSSRTCDFRYDKSFSDYERKKLLNSLLDELESCWHNIGGKVISFLYVPESAKILNEVLTERNFTSTNIGARYYIPINFETFDDYLNTFSGKRRRSIQSEIRKAQNFGISFECTEVEARLDRFVELSGLNFRKYNYDFDPEKYAFRTSLLCEAMKERAFFVNMMHEGEILGICLFIKYKRVLCARSVGIVNEVPKNIAAYFNLVFYKGVELALKNDVDYLVFGDGKDAAKLSRGCSMEKLKIYTNLNSEQVLDRFTDINHYVEGVWDNLKSDLPHC